MLSPRTSVSGEAHVDVAGVELEGSDLPRGINRYGHRGRMDTLLPVARRNALPAMPSRFLVQGAQGRGRPLEHQLQSAELGFLLDRNANALGVGFVERGLLQDQRFGIVTAFGGADFKVQFHCWFSTRQPVEPGGCGSRCAEAALAVSAKRIGIVRWTPAAHLGCKQA